VTRRAAWFGFALAADAETLVAVAPSETESLPQLSPSDVEQPCYADSNVPRDLVGGGAVYIYERAQDGWAEEHRAVLSGVNHISSFLPEELGGETYRTINLSTYAVEVSDEVVVVGAAGDSGVGPFRGSVRLLEKRGESWEELAGRLEPATLNDGDYFGAPVELSGDLLIVGAAGTDSEALDGSPIENSGAVYLYRRFGAGFELIERLTPPFADERALFGAEFAVSENFLAIAAPLEDRNGESPAQDSGQDFGGVYTYRRVGDSFEEEKPLAVEEQPASRLGFSVALSDDVLAVGAPTAARCNDTQMPREYAGAVHLYVRASDGWEHHSCLNGADLDAVFFGWAVALTEDFVVVGAPWTTDSGAGATAELAGSLFPTGGSANTRELVGKVFLFARPDRPTVEPCRLTHSNADACDVFGTMLAASPRGSLPFFAASAPYEDARGNGADGADNSLLDSGALYVYDLLPP
jgi:hypothetical protein